MSDRPTVEEAAESLTGFDELAVAKHFGLNPTALAQDNPMMFTRALIFVVKRHDGTADVDAKQAVLSMTVKEVSEFFADEDDDSGKGEATPERTPDA